MKIPAELLDRLIQGSVVLFLGAGATRDAGGPVGSELARLLAARFGQPDIPTDDLRRFADVLTGLPTVDREDVDAAIIQSVRDLVPSEAHYTLPLFCWKAIFTTNYDRLIERAYDGCQEHNDESSLQALHVLVRSEDLPLISDRSQLALFKLHGCISSVLPDTPLVLTTADYDQTAKNRGKMLRALKTLAKDLTLLFVGYSFADDVILGLLKALERESPYNSHRHAYLLTPKPSRAQVEYFAAQNILCLDATFSGFLEGLKNHVDREAAKACLANRLPPVRLLSGQAIAVPSRLRVALEPQLEPIQAHEYPRHDARRFLSGRPPTVGDLSAKNDVEREQHDRLLALVRGVIGSESYVRPLVAVVGAGGAGKSTLALRCAFDLATAGEAFAFNLKSFEQWNRPQIVQLAKMLDHPSVFVIENLELHSCRQAVKELRNELSISRCRTTLLLSCQKAVWNTISQFFSDSDTHEFLLPDQLSRGEAVDLIAKLAEHGLLPAVGRREQARQLSYVLDDCEGNLVVALLSLVRSDNFRHIVLAEFENLSERAQLAYQYVALLHQHRISVPDYVLNRVTVNDWDVFQNEIIRMESDLTIIQDLNYGTGRIHFRTRHPEIARVIVDTTVPLHEDRIRMYRNLVGNLGGAEEDRKFLITLLTTVSVRQEIRETAYIEEFFEKALDLFPNDRVLILHLGKYENKAGSLDRAKKYLEWGRSLEPRDSFIVHQLGVNYQKRGMMHDDPLVQAALLQEAEKLFRLKQELDPTSQYGFGSEVRLHLDRAKIAANKQVRLESLSAAFDAIQRGLALVRDDDKRFLEELKGQWAQALGEPRGVIAMLEGLRSRGGIRYASSYHLLAVCYLDLSRIPEAAAAMKEGLSTFPGDLRLIGGFVDAMEVHLSDPKVRTACRELLGQDDYAGPLGIRVSFLRVVIYYYEGNYALARRTFSEIRPKLGRKASTRVRVLLCDEAGSPIVLRGPVRRDTEDRLQAKDPNTGYWVPVDNIGAWLRQGKPPESGFTLGFSFAGFRARIHTDETTPA